MQCHYSTCFHLGLRSTFDFSQPENIWGACDLTSTTATTSEKKDHDEKHYVAHSENWAHRISIYIPPTVVSSSPATPLTPSARLPSEFSPLKGAKACVRTRDMELIPSNRQQNPLLVGLKHSKQRLWKRKIKNEIHNKKIHQPHPQWLAADYTLSVCLDRQSCTWYTLALAPFNWLERLLRTYFVCVAFSVAMFIE